MRRRELIATCSLAAVAALLMAAPTSAGTVLDGNAAASVVRSDGFSLVTRTEAAPGAWDVWASRDGIPYEVKVDARNGSVLKAVPLEDND